MRQCLLGLGDVVGGDEEGGAAGVAAVQELPELRFGAGVESERGLVEEEEVGLVEDGAGELEAALHAAGEGFDGVVGAVAQVEQGEQVGDAPAQGASPEGEEAAVEPERFPHGHLRI